MLEFISLFATIGVIVLTWRLGKKDRKIELLEQQVDTLYEATDKIVERISLLTDLIVINTDVALKLKVLASINTDVALELKALRDDQLPESG